MCFRFKSPGAGAFFLNLNLFVFLHSHRACEKGIDELPSGLFTKYLYFDFCLLFFVFLL